MAKEGVTMSGNHRITGGAGKRGVFHVPRAYRELLTRYTFDHNGVKTDFRYGDAGEQVVCCQSGLAGRTDCGGLLFPFCLKLLLGTIHAPVLAAYISKQA